MRASVTKRTEPETGIREDHLLLPYASSAGLDSLSWLYRLFLSSPYSADASFSMILNASSL